MKMKEWWQRMFPVTPEMPSHIRGVTRGNATGSYEHSVGHLPDGTSTAARSTGIRPEKSNPILPNMPNLSPP